MANLVRYTWPLRNLDAFEVFDDFNFDQSTALVVATTTDSGTVAMGDEANGVMTLTPSDGTVADNDEAYAATPNANLIFAANTSIYLRGRMKWAETAAGVYNAAFGAQNAVGANSVIDDGGGLKVSGSTLGIYKVDGESVFRTVSACNGVATVTKSTTPAVAATWYVLEIFCADWDGVKMQVTYKVDGQYLKDANGLIIRDTVAIASAAQMQVFYGAKLGAITNNDVLKADYWYAAQTRA
jgi:hypothetical protein